MPNKLNDYTYSENNYAIKCKTVTPLRGIYEIEKLYNIVSIFGGIIAGGYARYCASPRQFPIPTGDIDIFFPSRELYSKFIINKSKFFTKYDTSYESSSATTIIPSHACEFSHISKIQFIKPEFSGTNILDCINSFDFTICRAAILDLDTIVVDIDFIEHELENILVSRFIKNPVGFFSRLLKYNSMGYNIPPVEIYKLFESWSNLDVDKKTNLTKLLKSNDISKLGKSEVGLDYDLNQSLENSIYLKLLRFIPQMENNNNVKCTSDLPF